MLWDRNCFQTRYERHLDSEETNYWGFSRIIWRCPGHNSCTDSFFSTLVIVLLIEKQVGDALHSVDNTVIDGTSNPFYYLDFRFSSFFTLVEQE